jgi:polysaccharide pyruvyl transferase WcaK-like protein
MKRILFTGHLGFSNRGTEAILKSLCWLIKEHHKNIFFLIPSINPIEDRKIWGEDNTVKFVPIKIPLLIRIWTQLTRLQFLQNMIIKSSPALDKNSKKLIESADFIFSVGGDMYTYEGRFPLWIYLMDSYAYKIEKKVFLIGATVSNFKNIAHKNILAKHFKSFNQILVRDSGSLKRLKENFDIKNAELTSDSAFWLKPQKNNLVDKILETKNKPIVGINISPLLDRLGDASLVKTALKNIILKNTNFHFILIPHVYIKNNDDLEYLKKFKENLGIVTNVDILDMFLTSQELKYAISKLDILIAARTHATIAAYSTDVPVLSIAYSDKASGIAKDIYQTSEYVLNFEKANEQKILTLMNRLIDSDSKIQTISKENLEMLRKLSYEKIKTLNLNNAN